MKCTVCAEPQRGFRFGTAVAVVGFSLSSSFLARFLSPISYPSFLSQLTGPIFLAPSFWRLSGPCRALPFRVPPGRAGARPSPQRNAAAAATLRQAGPARLDAGPRGSHLQKLPLRPSDIIRLCAVLFVALYLVPTGAHLAELPNKIGLPSEQYMLVQGIYAGWDLFGLAGLGALIFTAAHTILVRGNLAAFFCSLTAFLCMVATQLIFWLFTLRMYLASADWTMTLAAFAAAHRQWEDSHVASAVLTFAALSRIIA